MLKKLNTETKLGGLFGLIALIAIIIEAALQGFTPEAIAGGIKDMAGTLAIVALFLIAVKNLIPKKQTLTFEEKLTKALDEWQKFNEPMIIKSKKTRVSDIEKNWLTYSLLTNPLNFFASSNSEEEEYASGVFVRMPIIKEDNYISGVKLTFYIKKETFFQGRTDEYAEKFFPVVLKKLILHIGNKFGDAVKVEDSNKTIDVSLQFPVETDSDIEKLINILQTMVNAYMVMANVDFK